MKQRDLIRNKEYNRADQKCNGKLQQQNVEERISERESICKNSETARKLERELSKAKKNIQKIK